MYLVFLGPPGSGKGTHAEEAKQILGIPRISTGDMFRDHIRRQTQIGKEAQGYIDKGHLVPDELVLRMIRERLQEDDCAGGGIFDGFPRTVAQAVALDEIVPVERVINLTISDESIIERMRGRRVCKRCGHSHHVDRLKSTECPDCGGELMIRDDDRPETVRERLRVYHEQTQPLIDYYDKRGILRNVDTDDEVEIVSERIRGVLE